MRRRCFFRLNAPPDRPRPPAEFPVAENGIRQQPADNTRTRTHTPQELGDATRWREILNPPIRPQPESDLDS